MSKRIVVYPVKMYDSKGALVAVDAVSRKRLRFASKHKTMDDALNFIGNSIESEKGKKFTCSDLPTGFVSAKGDFVLSEGSVSDSLSSLVHHVDPMLNWHLLYSVKTKSLGIRVHKRGDPLFDIRQGDKPIISEMSE
jgi:hypothetical protein